MMLKKTGSITSISKTIITNKKDLSDTDLKDIKRNFRSRKYFNK